MSNSCAKSTLRGLEGGPAFVGELGPTPVVLVCAGISSQSLPPMTTFLRKNGHIFISMLRDSFASAFEIGTGDDLITTATTSDKGIVRRFRVGVEVEPNELPNNLAIAVRLLMRVSWNRSYIQTLSATPGRRSSRQRRLISSWLNLSIWSRDIGVPSSLMPVAPLVGDLDRERARMRS